MQLIKCHRHLLSLNLLLIALIILSFSVTTSSEFQFSTDELNNQFKQQHSQVRQVEGKLQENVPFEDDLPVHVIEELNNILNLETNSLESKWNDEQFSSSLNYTGEDVNEQLDLYKVSSNSINTFGCSLYFQPPSLLI